MTGAEQLFNRTFFRAVRRMGFVQTFRQVVLQGMPQGTEAVERHTLEWLTDPSGQRVLRGNPSIEVLQEMSAAAAKRSAADTRGALDSASLIFAHTIIDDAAYQYCRVSALANPTDWEPDTKRRKVSLEELRIMGADAVFREALDKRLKDLEREALLTKVDLLFAKCRPGEEIHTPSFRFQRSELERLDDLRHQIVHGREFGNEIPTIDADLYYLSSIATMMMVMINGCYGFKIDPEFMWKQE